MSIYCEVIIINGEYRVGLTDDSMEKTHTFAAKFSDYKSAENYAYEVNDLLARFGGEYVSKILTPSNN